MKCPEKDCKGEIDFSIPVFLQNRCSPLSFSTAYPCKGCGRLYWRSGQPVFNRAGDKGFLEDGKVVLKNKKNKVVAVLSQEV